MNLAILILCIFQITNGYIKMININKYWIGYLTGIIISINLFSAGVILSYTLSLNYIYFLWIWSISVLILIPIKYLKNKQEKEGLK